MVLPGIQALSGFQLMAVFNEGFSAKLSAGQQDLHLVAIGLAVIAVMIIMTPAAYHRQQGGREVTSVSSRSQLLPLAMALCIDFYLVMEVISPGPGGPFIAAFCFAGFVLFWFVLPRSDFLKQLLAGPEKR
jgi:hypothetical protein